MAKKYSYLGPEQRAEIEKLHRRGAKPALIAAKIGVHLATIYRELPNGCTGALDENGRWIYSAELAQQIFERNIKRRGGRVEGK